jgi:polyisoprenoid-binding protein YceI
LVAVRNGAILNLMSATCRLVLTSLALALGAGTLVRAADYEIDPAASRLVVHVGKSGVLGFAGHLHEVAGSVHAGRVHADAGALARSTVSLEIRSADFHVVADKEPEGDAPRVQAAMERDVLEVEKHPDIAFESTSVKGHETPPGQYALELTGTLSLHGVSHPVTVPVDVRIQGTTLTATGKLPITHEAFGLHRASGGGGTVRVANELAIDFTLVAHEAHEPTP